MGTVLLFIIVIACTVGFMYLLIRVSMLFNRGGAEETPQQDAPPKVGNTPK
ncbi:MAG: hypothetical protein QHC78_08885 [Pigmentiphaga sp.]|uniref:hypothetical protein n=1 Tax=Pigmentiphaga sp. TaxID=1977564 RepID=UPI0029BEB886|nr:hypothetical protein [Pigmentiphaga sp.]MDX3905788.1 hypothetical protein [Pigmentiphaga sp.]